MAHQPNHRRTLAAPNTMDPTHKTHPKSTTKLRHHPHPHPQPDPTILPPTTIQNISHRFTKLYLNHKKTVQNSSKPHNSSANISQSQSHLPLHPEPDTDLQTKPPSFSPVSNTSCTALTKSNSQHSRNKNLDYYYDTKNKVKGPRGEIKKPSSTTKKDPKIKSLQEFDVKKGSQLMSKSLNSEKIEEGFEVRRVSLSNVPPPPLLGRRKSFCSSQIELADFLSCSGVKVVAVDMPPFMQIHAVDCARKTHDSLEKFTSKTLALTLKKEFDGVYGPAWHCIVGTSFGSFVTHSVGGFMYFSMDHKIYVLLFKTTVQRAE